MIWILPCDIGGAQILANHSYMAGWLMQPAVSRDEASLLDLRHSRPENRASIHIYEHVLVSFEMTSFHANCLPSALHRLLPLDFVQGSLK